MKGVIRYQRRSQQHNRPLRIRCVLSPKAARRIARHKCAMFARKSNPCP